LTDILKGDYIVSVVSFSKQNRTNYFIFRQPAKDVKIKQILQEINENDFGNSAEYSVVRSISTAIGQIIIDPDIPQPKKLKVCIIGSNTLAEDIYINKLEQFLQKQVKMVVKFLFIVPSEKLVTRSETVLCQFMKSPVLRDRTQFLELLEPNKGLSQQQVLKKLYDTPVILDRIIPDSTGFETMIASDPMKDITEEDISMIVKKRRLELLEARLAAERCCKLLKVEGKDLNEKIQTLKNRKLITKEFYNILNGCRIIGNLAVHNNNTVTIAGLSGEKIAEDAKKYVSAIEFYMSNLNKT
jgi:hypothetical protein